MSDYVWLPRVLALVALSFPPTTLFIYLLLCPGQLCQLYRGRDGSWPDPSATSVIIALRTYCPVHAGNIYLERVGSSRQKIAKLGNPFIRDGTVSHNTMDQTLYTCTHTHTCTAWVSIRTCICAYGSLQLPWMSDHCECVTHLHCTPLYVCTYCIF